jgi:hypothetical protein
MNSKLLLALVVVSVLLVACAQGPRACADCHAPSGSPGRIEVIVNGTVVVNSTTGSLSPLNPSFSAPKEDGSSAVASSV